MVGIKRSHLPPARERIVGSPSRFGSGLQILPIDTDLFGFFHQLRNVLGRNVVDDEMLQTSGLPHAPARTMKP
jgi:hypothetical protein